MTGRYVVESEVGRGGSAIVFRAGDLRHRRVVALKVLNPALTDRVGLDRFEKEIEITAGLQHPHVLPLLDSGRAGELGFFVMPFVAGGTVRDLLEAPGGIPTATAVTLGREVAGALAYAHRQGIVHLDVKPENILLSDGHAMVADFGVARALCELCAVSDADGAVFGTPTYMSPEQAEGGPYDPRSDVYSFGVLMYEALTGRPPFGGPSSSAVIAQHWARSPEPLHRVRGDLPAVLVDRLSRALEKNPDARPATMDPLVDALRLAEGTLPPGVRTPWRADALRGPPRSEAAVGRLP